MRAYSIRVPRIVESSDGVRVSLNSDLPARISFFPSGVDKVSCMTVGKDGVDSCVDIIYDDVFDGVVEELKDRYGSAQDVVFDAVADSIEYAFVETIDSDGTVIPERILHFDSSKGVFYDDNVGDVFNPFDDPSVVRGFFFEEVSECVSGNLIGYVAGMHFPGISAGFCPGGLLEDEDILEDLVSCVTSSIDCNAGYFLYNVLAGDPRCECSVSSEGSVYYVCTCEVSGKVRVDGRQKEVTHRIRIGID